MNKMTKNGIVFEYDIDLSTEIHVSDVDMTIIMGNLLDNAIEVCLDVEEKRRYINLDIACGYGLNNIRKIVEKYNGHFTD
jgi:hypothetical protein